MTLYDQKIARLISSVEILFPESRCYVLFFFHSCTDNKQTKLRAVKLNDRVNGLRNFCTNQIGPVNVFILLNGWICVYSVLD